MPTFEFSAPDGQTYHVDGPDGATPEQAFAVLQSQIGANPTKEGAQAKAQLDTDQQPAMSAGDPLASVPQPDTSAPSAGGGRGFINPGDDKPAPQTSGSTAKDMAINAFGGMAGGVAGAGAAFADAAGAKDVAAKLDEVKRNWEAVAKENGGDTLPGMASGIVGSVAPAFLVPEAKLAQLVGNAGLFGIPAFRDTLNAKLESGMSYPLALVHAAESFGVNMLMPVAARHGGEAAVNAVLGKGEQTLARTAAGTAAAGPVFGALDAASQAADKATDVAAGQENDAPWVDGKRVLASTIAGAAMHAPQLAVHAGSVAADRVGSPAQQFGRAFGQDVDSAGFNPVELENLNPNLRDVVPKTADPVADIFKTGSVQDAAAAAERAAGLTPEDSDLTPGDKIRRARPLREPNVEPKVDTTIEGAADERASADVRGVPTDTDGAGGADSRGVLDVPLGDGGTGERALDTRGGERAPEAGNERLESAPGDAAAVAKKDEYTGPTMDEVRAVADIPTTEKMRRAVELVGEPEFRRLVEEKNQQIRPKTEDQKAMAVEAAAIHVLALEHRRQAEPFATKPEANQAGLKEDAVAVPTEGGWALQLKTRPYSDRERTQAQMNVDRLNRGLAAHAPDMEPARVLFTAPTPEMAVGRRIGRLLGVKVVFIEDHPDFRGVAESGVAYVSPQTKYPAIAIVGHEVFHAFVDQHPQEGEALKEQVRQYLNQDRVNERLSGVGGDRARAEEEAFADLHGAMWMDPKFWSEMRRNDPNAFRKIAYAFMQAISHATQHMGRFKAEDFVSDVSTVRKIIAREMSTLAREEGVSRHNPVEAEETGQARGVTSDKAAQRNPLKDWLAGLGIDPALKREFAPGLTEQRSAMGRGGSMFRAGGLNLDALAERAWQDGYLARPDAHAMYDLMARAFGGERVAPTFGEGQAEAEMQRRIEREREANEAAAQDWALAPDEVEATGFGKADPDVQARVRVLMAEAEAHGVDGEGILQELAQRNPDATDHDYFAAAQAALESALPREGEAGARDRREAAGGADQEGRGLESYTEADLRTRAARDEAATRADKAAKAEADRRASAESPDSFRLTGSDRSADEAAARGQEPMFSSKDGSPLARIAENLRRFPMADPKGMPLTEFAKYARERRLTREALATDLQGHADGLLVPVKGGMFWGISRDTRPDGIGWRVTRFDHDMTPIGHHVYESPREAVLDVIGHADPERLADQPKFSKKDERQPLTREQARQMGDLRKKAQTLQELQAQGGDVYKAQLSRADRAVILESVRQLRAEGVPAGQARKQAVERLLEDTHAAIEKMRPSEPAFSRKEDKPFYSALARGIDGINAKSQPAEGWRAQIQGLVNKGAVKGDEVEWSGLNDWLKMKSGKVSKQEVQDFIAANGVQVHEVTKGSAPDIEAVSRDYRAAMQRQGASFDEAKQMIAQMRNFAEDKPYDEKQSDEGFALVVKDGTWTGNEIHDAATQSGGSTKYERYNLPGGKNYREVLLTIPERKGEIYTKGNVEAIPEDSADARDPDRFWYFKTPDNVFQISKAKYPEQVDARDYILREKQPAAPADANYRSKHWEEPNVLAHIRLDDRTDADGKKVLMVQELQSDWAQEGRRKGFGPARPATEAERTEWRGLEKIPARERTPEQNSRLDALDHLVAGLGDKVAPGPFVESTDKWLPLALKRVMKMAASEGYDRVAFVTGAQAAERFSLDKHLDQIRYDDAHAAKKSDFDQNAPEGHGRLMGYDRNGDLVIDKHVGHEELPEHVGKEISDRLLAQPAQYRDEGYNGHVRRRVLQGAGLKVEAKGMRGFYDQIVPTTLNKLLPKFGGSKVGEFEIDHEGNTAKVGDPDEAWPFEVWRNGRVINRHATRAGAEEELQEFRDRDARNGDTDPTLRIEQVKGTAIKQPGFDVTDAMREKTAGGVPMFSRKDEEPAKLATKNPSHGFHTREIQVDGQWRPIEDSTGRLIARGDFRAQQNFYRWFGDSAVTDARGRPLTLYHGTDKDFSRFDPKKIGENFAADKRGFFFTNDPKMASDYAENDTIGVNKRMGGNVMPAYVALKKPLIVDDAFLRSEGMAPIGKDEDVVSFWDNYQAQIHEWVDARKSDGVILVDNSYRQKDGEPTRLVVAFKPTQIKSAIGAAGTFDPKNPDIRFARKGTTTATANLPASAPIGSWERSKSVVSDLIDEGLTRSGVYRFTSPMSEGSVRAKAVAQNFANAERQARAEWQRIQDVIAKDFPDKTVREKMWSAADQENEILSGRLAPGANVGLASLTPRQRDVVEQLHAYGEELLQRAKDVGMFTGDGVPYWTPRMMVMLDANGDYVKPTEPGKKQTSGGDGRNVFTSSSNLKQRKYLTAADTESAMQAKGGELVRDITTMPMAMQRLERAVAGRELINQIKDLGKATGQPTVSGSMHEGFFTLDHPAFTTYQPRFEQDPATGKTVVQKDAHGDPILDRVPLYMSREFEGPVKAILSNQDGTLYRGYMLLKSKAMSAIMFSPLIHQMVIFGRALGYDPTMVGTVGLYFRGNAAKKDEALVRTALDAGLVPMGGNHAGMIDVTDIARGIGREGGLGDPNESWIAHGAKAIVGAVNKDAGAAAKRFVDKAGEFWHGTLLWDRVGDLQMGIFSHAFERLQSEGFDPKVAAVMAAHWGNRYAGAVGRENMGEYARKAANVLLFSRSFNAGNLGTIKDLLYGMPAGLRAKIEYEHGKAAASQAFTEARRKAVSGFIADAALSLIALSAAQSAVDKLKKDKGWDEIFGGYMDRAQRMAGEIKRHPMTPKSYSPWQLSPTHDNEPGKQDRVDMGEIPGAGGRHEYMRLPTGKVVEDLINWTTHPAETFSAKMSPLAKAAWQIVSNDKGFGVPVYDPDGSMAGFGVDVAKQLAKAQTPWDTIVTAWDKFHGKTTPIENAKLLGNMTGFSASQGHPQGPEAGVAAQVEERVKAQKLMAMEEVKRLLRYDKEDQARDKLEAIGLTPREVSQVIKKIENPKEMTPAQRRRFNQHGNEEDQQRMERVTR